MRTRILTAIVLCAVIIGALAQPEPRYFGVLLGVMLAAAAWEWSGFALTGQPFWRAAYVALVMGACVAVHRYAWQPAAFLLLLQAALVWWVLAFLWLFRAPARVPGWIAGLAGFCVLVPATMALLRIASDWQDGSRCVVLILAIAALMDTGGYFGGHAFGRNKLAPRVSPGKTWEGVWGGMLLVLVLAVLVNLLHVLPYAAGPFIGLMLVAAAFSVVGDLTESLFKRANGLKDSGRLFPGHGGVLDRIDSVTAAAPIMTLSLIWLGAGA